MEIRILLMPVVLFSMFIIQTGSCMENSNGNITKIEITEIDKSLLVYFKSEIGGNDPYEFNNTVLSVPHPDGKGFTSLPGIVEMFALESINGHKGVAIRFRPTATDEEIEVVRNRVKASSLVHKVFENVPPSRISSKDLR